MIIKYSTECIAIGTRGIYKSSAFVITGRIRVWFEESVFNYWTVEFADEKKAVLAEGYGLYSMLFPRPAEKKQITKEMLNHLDPGDTKKWKATFQLKKNQKTIMCESEGELFVPVVPYTARILDFSSPNGEHIVICEFNNEHYFTYNAHTTSFAELQLTELNIFRHETKRFPCKKCMADVVVQTFPFAQSCACPKCRTFYAADSGINFGIVEGEAANEVPSIVLGSKGIVKGIEYEIVGFTVKEEQNIYASRWREYTLFNPGEGFAFLSEFKGHWIYIRERLEAPVMTSRMADNFTYDREPFVLFNSYTYKVVDAIGEFPYNIFDNEAATNREYISPPELWIEEKNLREGITWYHGDHIKSKELEKAFAVDVLPPQIGMGAVQPTGFISLHNLVLAFLVGICVLAFVHLVVTSFTQEKPIINHTFDFEPNQTQVSFVSPRFHLDKNSSNLECRIAAGVNNSWFELNATLVNVVTGTEYAIEQGVEYYSGYTDGESWSEGGTSANAWFTSIPKGDYYLQVLGTKQQSYTDEGLRQFTLIMDYDVPMRSNLMYAALLLLIWPIGRYLLDYFNERKRWADSPHSPYEE